MKTKILLFLMTLLFAVTKVNAQAHNMKPGWCKYAKNEKGSARDESASAECQACKKENEKEKIAKAAEDKRRNDAAVAKAKANKAASDLAYKKKQQENAEKNKVTEVYVTMGKTSVAANKKPEAPAKKSQVKLTKDILFFADYPGSMSMNGNRLNYFLNAKNDTILKSSDYLATYGAFSDNKNNFPPNVGIVVLKQENTLTNGKTRNIADIVDIKGKRYFNDKNISTIFHLTGDYFVIGRSRDFGEDSSWGYNYRRIQEVDIYNIKTKKTITLEKDRRNVEIYVAFDHKKLEDEGLKPVLLRRYINYDEEIYCIDSKGEIIVKKYPSGR